jgi:DnaJ-class molecular chaperone
VIVETPVNLSKAQLKMFEEFAKSIAAEEHHPIKQSFKKAADQFHNN